MHNLLTISVEVKMCISKVWFINIYEVQRLTLLVRVLNTTFGSVTVNILYRVRWGNSGLGAILAPWYIMTCSH